MASIRSRRWSVVGNTLILVTLLALAGGVVPGSRQRPRLVFDESVGADLQALASKTWDRFLDVFQARTNCFGDLYLRAAYSLDSRAGYDPDTATATIQVPGTAAMLQSELIHEWAHHVEFQCPAHQTLRPAFLAAQGLPPDTPWRPDNVPANMPAREWAQIPSEQYAEATIEVVLGTQPIPTSVQIGREAIEVIKKWAAGK